MKWIGFAWESGRSYGLECPRCVREPYNFLWLGQSSRVCPGLDPCMNQWRTTVGQWLAYCRLTLPMFGPRRRQVLLPNITSCLPQSNTLSTLKAVKQLTTMFMYFLALYGCDVLTEFTPALAVICNISWVIQVIGTRWQTYPFFPWIWPIPLLATRNRWCCV